MPNFSKPCASANAYKGLIILICDKSVILAVSFENESTNISATLHHARPAAFEVYKGELTFIPRQLQGSNCLYIKSVHFRFNKSI